MPAGEVVDYLATQWWFWGLMVLIIPFCFWLLWREGSTSRVHYAKKRRATLRAIRRDVVDMYKSGYSDDTLDEVLIERYERRMM